MHIPTEAGRSRDQGHGRAKRQTPRPQYVHKNAVSPPLEGYAHIPPQEYFLATLRAQRNARSILATISR